jgi:hypothetical protein
LRPDQIADFTAVIKLDPHNADAFQARSASWSDLGEKLKAADDLHEFYRLTVK